MGHRERTIALVPAAVVGLGPCDGSRRLGRQPLTLSRNPDRCALRRSSPLPPGEGERVRIDELERLRALPEEIINGGCLPGTVGAGEEAGSEQLAPE